MAQLRTKDYDTSGNEVTRYEDHFSVMQCLKKSQEPEYDNRVKAREAHIFLNTRDGQWEQEWWTASDGKPRYTFDKTNPIVEQVASHLEKQDFGIQVKPEGASEESEDNADLIAGLVRSIENNSQAKSMVYSPTALNMVAAGVDGWEVVQKYIDDDSFDQDICIEKVHNWTDRVWFDPQSERQDHADAEYAFKMTAFTKKEFKKKWPKRSASASVDSPELNPSSTYLYQRELVIVGTIYYIKNEQRELALMSDGQVLEVNDDFYKIWDELEANGITVVSTRRRDKRVLYTRQFDGNGWIEKPQKTPFSYITLIPAYANFRVIDNKIIYWGRVEKLLDPQRVYNYAMSRHVEEVALAPRKKLWLTEKMIEGYASTIQSLNTNTHPVQLFNVDEQMPGYVPHETGGPQVNEGILTLASEMTNNMSHISGMFAANMGDNPNLQSGVAIESLQDAGDDGNSAYVASMEIAIAHTFRVIVNAIPRVYTRERQLRIVNEDMTDEVVTINQVVLDQQTMEEVVVRDLSGGKYQVSCKAGPSYSSRKERTVSGFIEVAKVKPESMDLGMDIFYKNMTAPGMDQMAERYRRQLFMSGAIPFEQLTDDEKQELQMMQQQQAQQGEQPDPMMIAAQAEMTKAQTQQMEAQAKIQTDQTTAQTKLQETYAKLALENRKQSMSEASLQQTQMVDMMRMQMDQNKSIYDNMKTLAETLDKIQESMGKDVDMRTQVAESAYNNTASEVLDLSRLN